MRKRVRGLQPGDQGFVNRTALYERTNNVYQLHAGAEVYETSKGEDIQVICALEGITVVLSNCLDIDIPEYKGGSDKDIFVHQVIY